MVDELLNEDEFSEDEASFYDVEKKVEETEIGAINLLQNTEHRFKMFEDIIDCVNKVNPQILQNIIPYLSTIEEPEKLMRQRSNQNMFSSQGFLGLRANSKVQRRNGEKDVLQEAASFLEDSIQFEKL